MKRQKITLALGGGGLKGYAHIGIIAALEENGYEIAGIAGTSAGGLFGSFFAFGYTISEILSFIDELDNSNLFQRMHNDPPSLIGLKGLYEILQDKFGDHTISQMKIPFATTAVDINTNREIYLNCGRIADAIKATIAIPGVFPYVILDSLTLVDGGVYDPIPVNLARCIAGEYPIIAVCLTQQKETSKELQKIQFPAITPIPSTVVDYFANLRLGKALEVFLNSMDIMQIVGTN
ncbi:MAG: patatin-like phospholipase family protein [Anaerolineaceae bacterium]